MDINKQLKEFNESEDIKDLLHKIENNLKKYENLDIENIEFYINHKSMIKKYIFRLENVFNGFQNRSSIERNFKLERLNQSTSI